MQELVSRLKRRNVTKLVLCVLDGLGGLPVGGNGERTELEAARTPNLDALASRAALGLHVPVAPGITPGSGAAHLALFGYDPLTHEIGRGVLEALGLGLEVGRRDIMIRGNFCTVSYEGGVPVVVDRRAGRIPTEENARITAMLAQALGEIGGVKIKLVPGVEHRFVLVLTFPEDLPEGADRVSDTDPQREGTAPLDPVAADERAARTAEVLREFVERAARLLRGEPRANYLLLRGVSAYPRLAGFAEVYGLRAAAVAAYPMYRGVAKLVGMEVLQVDGEAVEDEIKVLEAEFGRFDFFYLHVKKTDSRGEDGDFDAKVRVIEEFDALVPRIVELSPDVLVVTGDHSTPSAMRSHSWHPVPLLLHSPYTRGGGEGGFGESQCLRGELGTIRALELLPLMMAHAGRLDKFGA